MRSSLLILTASLIALASASAAEQVWTGNGGGGQPKQWTDPANWQNSATIVAGDALTFPKNVTYKQANNSFAADTGFGPLTIAASNYTLSGNRIALTGGLIVTSGTGSNPAATVSLPLLLNTTQSIIVPTNSVLTLNQAISGAGGFTKSGAGKVSISGTHSYTGPTAVAGGELCVTGTLPTAVQLISGALTGTGTVPGVFAQNQGTVDVAPGLSDGVGTLTSNGDVRLYASDRLSFRIAGNTSADKLVVNGTVNLGGCVIAPDLVSGYLPNTVADDDRTWVLIDNNGTDPVITGGDPSDYLRSLTIDGVAFQLLLVGGLTRNDVILRREADTAGTVTLNVYEPNTTTPAFSIDPTDAVDLRVSVTGAVSGSPVSFWHGATFIGTVNLNGSGIATLEDVPASTFGSGNNHAVTALFEGSASQAPKRSNVVELDVTGVSNPFTLAVSSPTSNAGDNVTLSVNFATGVAGRILFTDGGDIIADVTLDGAGDASFSTTTLVAGAHPLQAHYVTAANYITASSSVVSHTVNRGTTTVVTLTSSANPAAAGQDIELEAEVTGGAAGNVEFYDGAVLLGTRALSGATASLTTGGLSAGTHNLTARYVGSTTHLPDDGTLSLVVTPPPGGSTGGGEVEEEGGGCGLGGGTAAFVLGLLLMFGARLRRD
jgi:autotransporter-associated beta strand protein